MQRFTSHVLALQTLKFKMERCIVLPSTCESHPKLPVSYWSYKLREIRSHAYDRLGLVKASILAIVLLIAAMATDACQERATDMTIPAPQDVTGPTFNRITTSSKSFSVECAPTSITVTANVTAQSGIKRVSLVYRVGTDEPYTFVDMGYSNGEYRVTVNGADAPYGKRYGVWEFYITAEDGVGNQSQSTLDRSVEMLACVGS